MEWDSHRAHQEMVAGTCPQLLNLKQSITGPASSLLPLSVIVRLGTSICRKMQPAKGTAELSNHTFSCSISQETIQQFLDSDCISIQTQLLVVSLPRYGLAGFICPCCISSQYLCDKPIFSAGSMPRQFNTYSQGNQGGGGPPGNFGGPPSNFGGPPSSFGGPPSNFGGPPNNHPGGSGGGGGGNLGVAEPLSPNFSGSTGDQHAATPFVAPPPTQQESKFKRALKKVSPSCQLLPCLLIKASLVKKGQACL